MIITMAKTFLHELQRKPLAERTKLEKKLLAHHEQARTKWLEFASSGKPGEILAGGEIIDEGNEGSLELDARDAARNFLTLAIQHQHARLGEAYRELRGIAQDHWHPSIHEDFEGEFLDAVERLKKSGTVIIKLPPALVAELRTVRRVTGQHLAEAGERERKTSAARRMLQTGELLRKKPPGKA